MAHKIGITFLILVLVYAGIGLAFHIKWKSELNAGTPFATPCTHSQEANLSDEEKIR